VAKGPSATYAVDHIPYCGAVATVNEAIMLVPHADFAFFSDECALRNCEEHWDKIRTFVCPAMVHNEQSGLTPVSDILPADRNVLVTHRSQMDWVPDDIRHSIVCSKLVTTDTSVMGLHFLHLAGFKDFLLYGHDGGVGYAPGIPYMYEDRPMHKFREQIEAVADELAFTYYTRIEFADGKIIEH